MKYGVLIPTLSSLLILTGCAPTVFMGAATSVTTSAAEERGIGGVISDAEVKARIQVQWLEHKSELVNMIDIVVRQGRVLLTGVVDKPQSQIEAVRLVWKVGGVKEVIDETTVGGNGGFTQYAKDSWISTQLKSKILFDNEIRSINYNLQTVDGVVYLMGVAQSKKELDKVTNYARNISGVKKVVSYVEIKPQGNFPAQHSQLKRSKGARKTLVPQKEENHLPLLEGQPLEDAPIEGVPIADTPVEMESSGDPSNLEQAAEESPSQPLDAPNNNSSFQ